MKRIITTVFFVCFVLAACVMAAEQREPINGTKIWKDIPWEFLYYDATNNKVLFDLTPQSRNMKQYLEEMSGNTEKAPWDTDSSFTPSEKSDSEESGFDMEAMRDKIMKELFGNKAVNFDSLPAEDRKKCRAVLRKRYRELSKKQEKEHKKQELTEADDTFKAILRKNLGLDLPEGSTIEYDERKKRLRARSTKQDIKRISVAIENFNELWVWLKTSLVTTYPISGTCYTNHRCIFLVFVDPLMLNDYAPQSRSGSRGRKTATPRGKRKEVMDAIRFLDDKKAIIFVFDEGVSQTRVEEFKAALGINRSICVYQNKLSDNFSKFKGKSPVVQVGAHGQLIRECASLAEMADFSNTISYRRDY